MATASDILALATSYIGVKESPAGSNNVIFNTHYYGGPVNNKSLDWCVAFIWDIFRMADASDLFYGGGKTASCTTLNSYHKARGQAVSVDELEPGDIVFFDFSGKKRITQHVGVLESADGAFVTTIDGNTGTTNEANGGAVMRRRREKKYVSAAYRPDYESEDNMVYYKTLNDVPNWYKPSVKKAMDKGALVGDGTGAINVSEDMCRILTVLDRLGNLD